MKAKLRVRHILCLSLLLLLVSPMQASLPTSFNGWQTKSFHPISADQLEQLAGEDALLLHEYGFVAGERREYSREGSALTVSMWQMQDATASYGLFSFFQEEGMEVLEGDESVIGKQGRWLARRGAFVVDARGDSLSRDEAPMLLSEIQAPGMDLLPQLPDYFPEEDLISHTRKFLLGPVGFERLATNLPASLVGFHLGAEAAIAEYRKGGQGSKLLMISYATPQLAARQMEGFEALPGATEPLSRRSLFIRRKGSILAFVLGAPQDVAERLFDGIRYESVITWNERAPTPRDNIGSLVLGAFFLAGFCLLVALMGGLFFGGFRVLAKKFLPWEVFDRPSSMEIIKLDLYDK